MRRYTALSRALSLHMGPLRTIKIARCHGARQGTMENAPLANAKPGTYSTSHAAFLCKLWLVAVVVMVAVVLTAQKMLQICINISK